MNYGEDLLGQSQYSRAQGSSGPSGPPGTINLMDYLPSYYKNDGTTTLMARVQEAISREFETLAGDISDMFGQLFVETATWGLDLWEKELGIITDRSQTDNYRRSIILSKIRGRGITTADVLEEIATLLSGGQALVVEYPHEYRFAIKFIGVRGTPPNLSVLTRVINEIKPAHLDFSYECTNCLWCEAATYLWDEAHAMTWDEFRVAKPKYPLNTGGFTTWGEISGAAKRPTWGFLRMMTWETFEAYKPN